ncbi:hypothetical protein [Cohnella mopanensis]|uniref:hypothetical protein n=1 Tax=Cohnella mopanensis TaxID=2911966 RepID=UPI001EF7E653|nr:hypothetical protein [Cohnella mopanensis]
MQMKWKTMTLMALVICVLWATPGCGKQTTNGMKAQNYKNDGYLGRANSNPQLPGHHIVTNYNTDNRTMREAIRKVPGVADSSITFNGADAYVTIKLTPGLQAREIPTVEQQVATVLRFNYPRYTIHVKSMK